MLIALGMYGGIVVVSEVPLHLGVVVSHENFDLVLGVASPERG